MVIRTIKLTSLFVNTENYRFEPLSSQKEAIDKMIEDQGDKLYSLVDDIVCLLYTSESRITAFAVIGSVSGMGWKGFYGYAFTD